MIRSVFRGRGMLAAGETTEELLALAPYLDWIAPLAQLTSKAEVVVLKDAGLRVPIWEDDHSNRGYEAVKELDADGYIGQAESMAQLLDKIVFGPGLRVRGIEKALVSSVSFLPLHYWPRKWGAIPEVYWNEDPHQTPGEMRFQVQRRGGKVVSMCYGLYGAESGTYSPIGNRVLLATYRQADTGKDWCGFRAGTLSEEDLTWLKA